MNGPIARAISPAVRKKPVKLSRRIDIDVECQKKVRNPKSQALIGFWKACMDRGELPCRDELPSRDIIRLAPHLILMEPLADGHDWRIRLFGSALAERFGGDPTGLLISELYREDQVARNAAVYKGVLNERRAHVTRGRFFNIGKEHLRFEIVHLPIHGPRRERLWMMIGIFFD